MEDLKCVCGHGEYDHHESSGECRECDCICFVVVEAEGEAVDVSHVMECQAKLRQDVIKRLKYLYDIFTEAELGLPGKDCKDCLFDSCKDCRKYK